MRAAARLRVETDPGWRPGFQRPPRLALIDDEGDEMDSIPLKELAAALAPYLTTQVVAKEETNK